jgi:hypothetical protein
MAGNPACGKIVNKNPVIAINCLQGTQVLSYSFDPKAVIGYLPLDIFSEFTPMS